MFIRKTKDNLEILRKNHKILNSCEVNQQSIMKTVYDKNISNVNFYSLITCFSARENIDKPDQVLFCSSFLKSFIN